MISTLVIIFTVGCFIPLTRRTILDSGVIILCVFVPDIVLFLPRMMY